MVLVIEGVGGCPSVRWILEGLASRQHIFRPSQKFGGLASRQKLSDLTYFLAIPLGILDLISDNNDRSRYTKTCGHYRKKAYQ
jgi:hypothetical protein